jgi:hypothetical protein
MLEKSSILLMLLLGTASLIGISGIYQPANVETQPQPLIKEPARQIPGAGQVLSDAQFLDRMMPKIIQRMDGKVLAEKILPHLTVGLKMGDNYGPLVEVKKDPFAPASYHIAEARCPPGFRVMGGGGQINPSAIKGDPTGESSIVQMQPVPTQRFTVTAKMETSGNILAYATCLGEAVIGLKP